MTPTGWSISSFGMLSKIKVLSSNNARSWSFIFNQSCPLNYRNKMKETLVKNKNYSLVINCNPVFVVIICCKKGYNNLTSNDEPWINTVAVYGLNIFFIKCKISISWRKNCGERMNDIEQFFFSYAENMCITRKTDVPEQF